MVYEKDWSALAPAYRDAMRALQIQAMGDLVLREQLMLLYALAYVQGDRDREQAGDPYVNPFWVASLEIVAGHDLPGGTGAYGRRKRASTRNAALRTPLADVLDGSRPQAGQRSVGQLSSKSR